MSDNEVWTPVKMAGSRPVRKYPENSEIVARLVKKRLYEEEMTEKKKPEVKKGRWANFEMPTFTLGNQNN